MVNQSIEKQVKEFLDKELPVVTTIFLKKIEIGEDEALQDVFEAEDIIEMLKKYFQLFEVDGGGFSYENYFPWKSKSILSLKSAGNGKEKLTQQMLIESAKSKYWLHK